MRGITQCPSCNTECHRLRNSAERERDDLSAPRRNKSSDNEPIVSVLAPFFCGRFDRKDDLLEEARIVTTIARSRVRGASYADRSAPYLATFGVKKLR